MNTGNRISYGLFDPPVRLPERERISFSRDDIERQLEAGAFFMGRNEAMAAGFLSPHDEPDTVIVEVREDV